MPIYEYRCECGNDGEFILPIDPEPQICGCGRVMQRKMSVSSFAIKQTGNNMALNTLNAKPRDGGLPNKYWKADAEKFAATGL